MHETHRKRIKSNLLPKVGLSFNDKTITKTDKILHRKTEKILHHNILHHKTIVSDITWIHIQK